MPRAPASDPLVTIRDALASLPRPARVFVAGCGGEPALLREAIAADPDAARDLSFTGVFIPGVNRTDYAALAPGASADVFFVTPEMRESFVAGRVRFRPMHYTAAYAFLRDQAGCSLAFSKVAPPRPDGRLPLGTTADFLPAMLEAGVPVVAEIDPAMPVLRDAPSLAPDQCALVVEAPPSPVIYDAAEGAEDPAYAAIGRHVASLVRDGDTIQLGIGKVAAGVLGALGGHRRLSVHSGLATGPMLPLVEAAVVSGTVTVGTILGGPALYRAVPSWERLSIRPVRHTHAAATLAAIERFVAVNAVLTVDLFGQANGETLAGRQISGHGGMVDFVRGARLSPGGRAILALPSTAGRDRKSRIVPALPSGMPASLARADADVFVTEHGIADVRDLDVDARAAAIVAIADPAHRDALANDWDALRRAM